MSTTGSTFDSSSTKPPPRHSPARQIGVPLPMGAPPRLRLRYQARRVSPPVAPPLRRGPVVLGWWREHGPRLLSRAQIRPDPPRRQSRARSCRARPACAGPTGSPGGTPPSVTGAPTAAATAMATSAPSATGARSTSQQPSSKVGATAAATPSARRVFPTPPTPVNVSSRSRLAVSARFITSSVRPRSSVRMVGRLVGTASTVRRCGNVPPPTWKTCSGAARSRSRCSPRLRIGTEASARLAVAREHTTCPPWAVAMSRAARLTAGPK